MKGEQGKEENGDFFKSGVFFRKSKSEKSLVAIVDQVELVQALEAMRNETGVTDGKLMLTIPVRFIEGLLNNTCNYAAVSLSNYKKNPGSS